MNTNSQLDASARIACGLVEEVARSFGQVRLRVTGTSMVPSILPGDLISIQSADMDEILPGEIVLFSQEERLILHRVVDRRIVSTEDTSSEPCLITRGDRVNHDDAPVFTNELLGRLVSVRRGDRQVRMAARAGRCKHLMMRWLRSSDRATSLYVRLVACWQIFSTGRTTCRV